MSTFSKKLQKFLIYFFTSVSAVVIVLGIDRVKETNALGVNPIPENNSDTSSEQTEQNIIKNSNTFGNSVALLEKTVTAKGATYQTPWGTLSTKIQVKNGKIVAVEIPELPDSPPSIYAEPHLIEQALRTGSSNIQGVSGATVVSNAFIASLESAIAKANAQAVTQGATTVVTSPTTTNASITSGTNSTTSNSQPTKYRKSKKYHDDDEEDGD